VEQIIDIPQETLQQVRKSDININYTGTK